MSPDPDRLAPAAERARIGVDVHRFLGEALAAGHRHPSPLELAHLIAAHRLKQDGQRYRQAARQALLGRAAIYFRFFAPPDTWRFAGCEVAAGRARFDLVWQAEDEGYLIDELKTGRDGGTLGAAALDEQLELYRAEASAKWGAAFAGMRVLYLAAPRDSFAIDAGGGRTPLAWEGCG